MSALPNARPEASDSIQARLRANGYHWIRAIWTDDRALAVAALAAMLALGTWFLALPYYWDSLWIAAGAQYIRANHLIPITPLGWDPEGHPLLLLELIALAWFLLGEQLWVAHLVMLLVAGVAVYFTYKVGHVTYGRDVGVIAALLLLCYPLFVVQSSTLQLDVLACATTTTAIYCVLKGYRGWYVISASAMVLSKAPTVLLIPAVLVYVLFGSFRKGSSWQTRFLELAVYSSPVLVLVGWFWYHARMTGWYISPDQPNMRPGSLLVAYLPPDLWAPGGAGYQFVYAAARYFGKLSATGLVTLLVVAYTVFGSHALHALRGSVPWRDATKQISMRSALRRWKPSELLLLLALPILIQLAFMASNLQLFRYLLPVYPGFFVLVARAVRGLLPHPAATAAATGAIILIFGAGWVKPWFGFDLDSPSSFMYLDYVNSHKAAAGFIESHYPGKRVLAGWPEYVELAMPIHGYVERPVPVLTYPPELCDRQLCAAFIDRMDSLGEPYFVTPDQVQLSDFDLIYYSMPDWPDLQDRPDVVPAIVAQYQLPQIAEFRSGGGRVILYGNPRQGTGSRP